ncbi:TPA: DUF1804 family protein [Burkholderia vietnamiensis]|uniref:DUF1804 family protein n=1 Tax=Burkholderia vietnamiensis TaxID=60552 RepID=UPI001B990196|nr:DUF1804 family protein [Burkholderia vietnamiensis]MBR8083487.1 DUF1804 family protein [Burkholderia vietnamiensis]MCA8212152.1 DUF1804 family protein [Burkholderia vietnamiensis]HDR9117319.1 DUF1804 family protein [Burkholderia vietnamiensis]HDR9284572.1 DUF1804 family protein [Burkholderia vietnamiensis]
MSKSHATRTVVRNAVIRGQTLKDAATRAGVDYSTARRWRIEAAKQGDDWYRIRQLASVSPSEIGASQQAILKRAVDAYEATLNEIIEDRTMPPIQRAEALAALIHKLGALQVPIRPRKT